MFGYKYTICHMQESKGRPETTIRTKNPISIGDQLVYGNPQKQTETLVGNVLKVQHLVSRSIAYVECVSDGAA
ncbi:hypothetical protein [Enterovibrio norvegicus]|uniref:hypothetical protein n=1 Tax=Enterovibrio norvegicus TaxID=188144 RepID=UPI00352D8D49